MALDSFILGPNPKWYFVNNNGKPLAGGTFNTFSSLNKSLRQSVYTTPSEDFPLPNPATIDANGTLGPFWFAFDSTNPDNGYYIEVRDALGQLIWSIDDYFGSGSGGGGGTTIVDNLNLINNNIMWRHTGTISQVPTFSVIAPSNHVNLVGNQNLSGKSIVDSASPDIVFIKNNQSGTDQISFINFNLGDQPIMGDIAPVDYMNYTMSIAGTETTKFLQFPITAKVQNLSGQDVIGSFWAKSSTLDTIEVRWYQFYGDGPGASASDNSVINSFVLSNTWQRYNISDTIPSAAAATLGGPSAQGPNDALFIRFYFPASQTSNIDFTKPTLYLGNNLPDNPFIDYDNIEAITSQPRTGDVRISLNSFAPYGWVACNDGVISNGSGAIVAPLDLTPVARNNIDTYPLYYLIWNQTSGAPGFAPIYDSAGAVSTRGADAITDFSNGKQLKLTRVLGRVLAGSNPLLLASQTFTADSGTDLLTVTDSTQFPTGTPVLLVNAGGALPTFAIGGVTVSNDPPIYYTIRQAGTTTLKLAISVDDAEDNVPLDITANGSGTNSLLTANTTYFGEGRHIQTVDELAAHTHPPLTGTGFGMEGGSGSNNVTFTPGHSAVDATTGQRGSSTPMNNMQATAFMNIFLKL